MPSFVGSHWRGSLKPPDRRPIYEYARDEITLPHSARSTSFEIGTSPWLKRPFDVVTSNLVRSLTIIACTQGSKTTFLELLIAWLVDNDPGPTMLNMQSDDDAKIMKETRLDGVLKASPRLAARLPERLKNRKDGIIFPHMPLWIHGANLNNLQGRSVRWLLCDEGWAYKPQSLHVEAHERTTSFWNARIVNTGQGGVEGDETDKQFLAGSQDEWGFTCPECGLWQPFSFDNLTAEEIRDAKGGYNFDAMLPTVRYACDGVKRGECNLSLADTVANRRQLANLGSYVAMNPGAPSDLLSFHWNRLTVYWNEWAKLHFQRLRVEQARARGDNEPRRQFIQKVEGRSYKESETDFETPVARGEFKLAEAWPLEGTLHGFRLRVMTVDVQQDCFYILVRSWSNAPDTLGFSRLVNVKLRAVSWDDVRDFQLANNVPDCFVFVDAGHNGQDVYRRCARYHWNALLGDDAKTYPHRKRKKNGKMVEVARYYSRPRTVLPGKGLCLVYRWSNLSVKDTLATLREHQAEGVTWEAASDTPEEYFAQMDSETRREVTPGVWRWIKTNKDNHLWDCEAMQIAVAYMLKLVGEESLGGGEESEDDTKGEE